MPKIIAAFPSRRGSRGRGHQITEDEQGNLRCSCEAGDYGQDCWALKKIRGDREFERLMNRMRNPEPGPKFDPRKEVQEQVSRDNAERKYWYDLWIEYSSQFPREPEEPLINVFHDPNDIRWLDDGLES